MARFKIIFLLLILIGCLGPTDNSLTVSPFCEEASYSGAHFEVGKFELNIIYPSESDESIQQKSFILDFRVPITEVSTKQPMTEAEFTVHTFENYNKIMKQQKELCGEEADDPKNKEEECQLFKSRRCDDQVLGGCMKGYTGADGYIYWSEEYEYPVPETLKWIRFERVISNLGSKVIIPFAVNPWLEEVSSTSKFLDLTKSEPSYYLQEGQTLYRHDKEHILGSKESTEWTPAEFLKQCRNRRSLDTIFEDLKDENPPVLYIPEVNLRTPFQSGQVFLMDFVKIPIELINKSYDKGTVLPKSALSGSKFKVTPLLLSQSSEADSYHNLHDVDNNLTKISTLNTDGTLDISIPVKIHKQSSYRHMTLALKVEPMDEKSRIKPFYGLYDISKPSSQLNEVNSTLKLKEGLGDSGVVEHLDSIKNLNEQHQRIFKSQYTNKNQLPDGSPTEDLSLKFERIRFIRVGAYGDVCETPVNREVIYNIEFCLSNPQNSSKYLNTDVDVVIEDIKRNEETDEFEVTECLPEDNKCRQPVKTSRDGCVASSYAISHFPYNLQQYLLKRITFKSNTGAFTSTNEQYVVLNPWEYGFLTYQNVTNTYEARERARIERKNCKENGKRCESGDKKFKELDKKLMSIISSDNLKPPRIRINEYRSSIIEPSYLIEPSLDITTVKNIQLLMQPSVVRTDSIGETIRQVPSVLPVGHWIMRVILAKGPQEMKNSSKIASNNSYKAFSRLNPMNAFFDVFKTSDSLEWIYKWNEIAMKDEIPARNADDTNTHPTDDISKMFIEKEHHSKLASPFDPSDYISHHDMVVKGENSVVSAFMEQRIPTEHFRYLGSKNSMLIELYPVDYRGLRYKKESQCDLDLENSKFAVMKKCKLGIKGNNCHDLETPVHWGLFSISEVIGSHIVWPIENFNSSKTFGIDPLPACLNESCDQIDSEKSLSLSPQVSHEDNLLDSRVVKNKFHSGQFGDQGVDEAVNRKYRGILKKVKIVDNNDHLDQEQYQNFCKEVEKRFTKDEYINQKDILGKESKERINEYKWDVCICDADPGSIDEKGLENGAGFLKSKIKKCKLMINLSLQKTSEGKVQINTLNAHEDKDICNVIKTQSYTHRDNKDYSPVFESYQKCVCDSNSKWAAEDKTERIARCFAEREGLAYTSVPTFLSDLNQIIVGYNDNNGQGRIKRTDNKSLSLSSYEEYEAYKLGILTKQEKKVHLASVDAADITLMVQEGFSDIEENFKKRSFLHSMCTYWFENYYLKHANEDIIKNFYNYQMKGLVYASNTHTEKSKYNQWSSNVDKISDELYKELGFNESFINRPFEKLRDSNHPFWRCFKNPLLFFHIERKIMVGQIDGELNQEGNISNTKYKNGRVYTYIQSSARGTASQKAWSQRAAQQLKSGVNIKATATVGKDFSAGIGGDVAVNLETTQSKEDSNTNRAQQDEIKSVTLAVNHINIDIGLKEYRSCLIIKPKTSSFNGIKDDIYSKNLRIPFLVLDEEKKETEREKKHLMRLPYQTLGLMICDNETKTDPLVVPEDYYYIHQFFGGHSYEFMSRTIYHNRPFTELIRGQHVMDQFTYLMNRTANNEYTNISPTRYSNMPRDHFAERAEIDKHLIPAFEESTLDRIGFYKGIYTYSPSGQEYYDPHITDEQIDKNKQRNEAEQTFLNELLNSHLVQFLFETQCPGCLLFGG